MTTLQSLHDALAIKAAQLAAAKTAAAEASRDIATLKGEVEELRGAIESGRLLEIKVSDHALLRYAQRVLGFDPAEVTALIRDKVAPMVYCLGDGKYPLAPGFHAVVQARTVVTIEPAGKWVDESKPVAPAKA